MEKGLFKDKVVVITAGGNALGLALAELFGITGARIIILEEAADDIVEKIQNLTRKGIKVKVHSVKYRDDPDMRSFLAKLPNAPDILVNLAGIDLFFNNTDLSSDAGTATIQSALQGSRNCIKYFSKVMNKGSIINILPFPSIGPLQSAASAYSSVKEGLSYLTTIYARELAPSAIRVNSIVPGYFQEMLDGLDKEVVKSIKEKIPTGEVGTFNDIFNVCVFLSGDDAGYITGTSVTVDGGYFA